MPFLFYQQPFFANRFCILLSKKNENINQQQDKKTIHFKKMGNIIKNLKCKK